MGILQDIKRLDIQLEEPDRQEIEKIVDQITREKEDEFIRNALIEGAVGEFLANFCPEVMEALIRDKEKQNEEWRRLISRKFDEKGNRVCDEQFCPSVDDVAQCKYCGKYVCREHNYLKGSRCCYACSVSRFSEAGEENG